MVCTYICFFKSNKSIDSNLTIQNFTYSQMLCSNYSITGVQNVLYTIILHLPYTVRVVINLLDTEYKNLHNVTVLYYYCYSYARASLQGYSKGNSRLNINNIKVYNNTGNSVTNLLVVKVINC